MAADSESRNCGVIINKRKGSVAAKVCSCWHRMRPANIRMLYSRHDRLFS